MTLPRGILPERVSALATPGVVKRRTNAGLTQIRSITAIGWTWQETFGLLRVSDEDQMAVMTFIKKAWHAGDSFLVKHLMSPGSGRSPNGTGTASVLVVGAGQTGNSVLTDGWPADTPNVVVAGDVIKIAGEVAVYMVTGNVDSSPAGEATLPLNPPLRSSPADNALVDTTDVEFLVTILSRSKFETTRAPTAYAGYQIRLIESLL